MKLSDLNIGEIGVVMKVLGHGAFRKRVMEMGFVRGHVVQVVNKAPLNDPITYKIMGYNVSLRLSEAELVEVIRADDGIDAEQISSLSTTVRVPGVTDNCDTITPVEQPVAPAKTHLHHTIRVALIGNPNCGKTSLFNISSGARERVGNYSGVTVDAKTGYFNYKGYRFEIVDLPGTYSLTSYSPEELYVRQYLKDNSPDVIINVVNVSNLERNLYLTTELIDMDRSMVIALNMYDELRSKGVTLRYQELGAMIGVPMVPVVARNGEGIEALFDTVIEVYEERNPIVRHIHVWLGQDTESAIRKLVDAIKADRGAEKHFSPRYIAIKLLENDNEAYRVVSTFDRGKDILRQADILRGNLESLTGQDMTSLIASEKYGFIDGALAETMTSPTVLRKERTGIIDSIVTSKIFGFPIFFAIMFVIFWATFFIGRYPMDWIEGGVSWLSGTVARTMPDGMLKDLIADGIIGGVGGVIVFLPNILILYFCISFMEDTGYMARAAFIMDKVMHRIGLHGKSFIPLVMGFGCNVPAVLASRTIESRSSKIITILINPFMSCSARLPLYVLLIGAFFPNHQALVFFGVYLAGIIVAVITARLLRKFLFKKDETPFVMELPPYRIPTLKASVRHTWGKGVQYLKKMGGTILFASIVVWALNYFPVHDNVDTEEGMTEVYDDSAINPDRDSYLEMIGKWVNPVMEPLGFKWRATVAAIAGVPAKEIVVSTLGVLYAGDEAEPEDKLAERITTAQNAYGEFDFSPAVALSLLIFVLLYSPCIATVKAISSETGSWKWGAFSMIYNTLVAWLAAFGAYRLFLLFYEIL